MTALDTASPTSTRHAVAAWLIPLVGDAFDLEDFPRWLAWQSIQVVLREGQYVLRIPATLVGGQPHEVRAFAEDRLAVLNGIGPLLFPDFRPIALGALMFAEHADGKGLTTILPVAPAQPRMKGQTFRVSIAGDSLPDARVAAAEPFLKAAAASRRVHDALVLLGRPQLTWSELYLIFEIVQEDAGRRMYNSGWINEPDAERFTRTACSYQSLGIEARHGHSKWSPPTHPMTHEHASRLVRGLLAKWLRDSAARSVARPSPT